ncbi:MULTISPECIES: hypothetical protein [Rhizobium/Agrobacterium group]|uniref:hypothetical protein n=1 Tax=Rhizobium/Agrobacterium group TaxID=227290 RepID=UPI000B3FA0EB|nr:MULTISPECIES: hypothetical protein [Rhizobium/Agrobacterium group]MCF1482766.1 hypothetical protein [Allorhizobium ampelinum]NSZ43592.1 hypothetical protein [Agrobacterium vitis]NTA27249.1 hypothetical protein [Allorhizobium ampelinum]OVE94318.1 hypothetical protein B7W85_12180 [Allorhizobium ampelinum]
MRKIKMVKAYFVAVIAGILVVDVIILTLFLTDFIFVEKSYFLPSEIFSGFWGLILLFLLIFAYEFPIAAITAAPFTLACIFLIGIAWDATYRNSIMLGALCPIASISSFSIIFIMPMTAAADTEKYRFNEYILPALALSIPLIPSGAVAGSVFWRMGLRPKAPQNQAILQNQS